MCEFLVQEKKVTVEKKLNKTEEIESQTCNFISQTHLCVYISLCTMLKENTCVVVQFYP